MGPSCHCVLKEFEGFDLGLLLEQIQNRGPVKIEVSTQIENGGPNLGATAEVALMCSTPHTIDAMVKSLMNLLV